MALFVRMADESYVHARDRQIAIADVLEDHLKRIDWDSDGNARRLHLRDFPTAADVIIDPRFPGPQSRRITASRLRAAGYGQTDPLPAEELEALQAGHLFCLVSGNLDIDAMTQAFMDALPKIERAAQGEPVGFWDVDRDGKIKRMWP